MQWNHLICEGYCCRKWSLKKSKYFVDVVTNEKIPNKVYDSNYKTPRKPKYCKNKVCFTCWEKHCKFLVMTSVDEKTFKMFMKAWWSENK